MNKFDLKQWKNTFMSLCDTKVTLDIQIIQTLLQKNTVDITSILIDDTVPPYIRVIIQRMLKLDIYSDINTVVLIASSIESIGNVVMVISALKVQMYEDNETKCSFEYFIQHFDKIPSIQNFNTLWKLQKIKEDKSIFSDNYLDLKDTYNQLIVDDIVLKI